MCIYIYIYVYIYIYIYTYIYIYICVPSSSLGTPRFEADLRRRIRSIHKPHNPFEILTLLLVFSIAILISI